MGVNENGLDEARVQCVGCGEWTTSATPCALCEDAAGDAFHYVGLRLHVDAMCGECLTRCTCCGRPVCEYHMTGDECEACAGPRASRLD